MINEALWCYKDDPANESYSPDVQGHACLVQTVLLKSTQRPH